MNLSSFLRHAPVRIVGFGLLAFVLLTIRFSPNWVAFYHGLRDVKVNVSSSMQSAAIEKAILSGYSARGLYVIMQARDLDAGIDDSNHKIVRWRLLVPVLGHFLKLPGWLILGLAHLGCLALILTFVAIGSAQSAISGRPSYEAICLGVIAGASAPFFTSMGLLGYYDSWLALALLGVSFARQRWVVLTACLLAPWIDERFVIGLPLALCVRWILSDGTVEARWAWFKNQALIPIILATGYSMIRLKLGGSGGSQTVGQYLDQFVFAEKLSMAQRLFGAWEGLGLGWVLVAVAILGCWRAYATGIRLEVLLLTTGVALTGLIGLFTALDLSRSMVLIIPVVPLGWVFAARTVWWSKFYTAVILAATALLLPTRHVVGRFSRPVDNIWSPSMPLMTAQNNLGVMYANGEEVPKNNTEALKWYRKAAEQGNAQAQLNLGVMYAKGEGVSKNSAEAVKWYRNAAGQDFADAQNTMGVMYSKGEGVPVDSSEAMKWYRKAAEQGDARAQCNLGTMYFQGDGVPKDSIKAEKWIRKAAEQGHAQAQLYLGLMYDNGDGVQKDGTEAVKWYRKAAEQGDAGAQCNLGLMYFQGNGVPKDSTEAVKWYRKAAKQGDAGAQCNLGLMYFQGEGVPKDSTEAVRWYRKAAEQGHAGAQYNLGLIYLQGEGVPKDGTEAVKWYRKAAEQGHAHAQLNLGVMYAKGEGVSKDSTEAVKWFRKAVDQGNAQAQLNLGVMYFLGEGVPRNLVQAHFWLYVANAKGQEAAKKYLAVIEKDMTPDQMADAANLARKMLQKQPKEQ